MAEHRIVLSADEESMLTLAARIQGKSRERVLVGFVEAGLNQVKDKTSTLLAVLKLNPGQTVKFLRFLEDETPPGFGEQP